MVINIKYLDTITVTIFDLNTWWIINEFKKFL